MGKLLPQNLYEFIWHFYKKYYRFYIPFILLATLTGFWPPINSQLIKYMIDALNSNSLAENPYLLFWPCIFFLINYEIHNQCWRGMEYLNYKYQPKIKSKIIK